MVIFTLASMLLTSTFFSTGPDRAPIPLDPSLPPSQPLPPRTEAEQKQADEQKNSNIKIHEYYTRVSLDPAKKEMESLKKGLIILEEKIKTAKDKRVAEKVQEQILENKKKMEICQVIINWASLWVKETDFIYKRDYAGYAQVFEQRQKIQWAYHDLTNEAFPHPCGPYEAELRRLQKEKDRNDKKKSSPAGPAGKTVNP